MELKKGDVVAVVAEVLEERDGKIVISIKGATVSDDLILAPERTIRILERAPSPGDAVLYKGKIKCIYRNQESPTVVSLIKDGESDDDAESYLFAKITDIRRIDQAGTVKFVKSEKSVPQAETGRDIVDGLEREQPDHEAAAGQASDASQGQDLVADVMGKIKDLPATAQITEPDQDSDLLESIDIASMRISENRNAAEPALAQENEGADQAQTESSQAVDLDAVDQSDNISIEMPERAIARREMPKSEAVVDEREVPVENNIAPTTSNNASEDDIAQDVPVAATVVEEAPAEEVVPQIIIMPIEAEAISDAKPEAEVVSDKPAEDDKVSAPEPAAAGNEAPQEAPAQEAEKKDEMTEAELEEKRRRLETIRRETMNKLGNPENGDDILDDIENLDDK